jgi:hypothetical protein
VVDAGSRQEDARQIMKVEPRFDSSKRKRLRAATRARLYLRVILSIASSRAGAAMQLLQILSLFFSLASSA